jgi:hypothetical protein
MKTLLTLFLALGSLAHAESGLFTLKPDFKGPCAQAQVVDVNLGNTPETFVQACACQVTGKAPAAAVVQAWAQKLRTDPRLRRVDVVRTFLQQAGRSNTKLSYSNPWANDPELPAAPKANDGRQIGAIFMFFFHCPGGVNCGMDWANSHVHGMQQPTPMLGWNGQPGLYNPGNPGFWARELRDARSAGLDFILPNVYGPDLAEGGIKALAMALAKEDAGVKIGLMDDTWAWGTNYFGPYWQQAPSFDLPGVAADKIYNAKWKPFFSTVPKSAWALVDGRPLIYFYNANKILPLKRSSETISRLKSLFRRDFGVEPYVALESSFYADSRLALVGDARYAWNPLKYGGGPDRVSHVSMRGKRLSHAIVRWDSVGRDHPGALAGPGDEILKGPELMQGALEGSKDSALLVFATWNDLGEGTGINRAYDYWYKGEWLQPDHFIRMIRDARAR